MEYIEIIVDFIVFSDSVILWGVLMWSVESLVSNISSGRMNPIAIFIRWTDKPGVQ